MDPNLQATPPSPIETAEDAGERDGSPRRSIPVIVAIAVGIFLIAQVIAYFIAVIISYVITLIAIEGSGSIRSFPTFEFLQIATFFTAIAVGSVAPLVFLLASRSFGSRGDERAAKAMGVIAAVLAALSVISLISSALFPSGESDFREMAEQVEEYSREAAVAEGKVEREEPADFTGARRDVNGTGTTVALLDFESRMRSRIENDERLLAYATSVLCGSDGTGGIALLLSSLHADAVGFEMAIAGEGIA